MPFLCRVLFRQRADDLAPPLAGDDDRPGGELVDLDQPQGRRGLGGALATGRVLDYLGRGDGDRKLCGLYLSLMNRMGVKAERFGDAAAPLADL